MASAGQCQPSLEHCRVVRAGSRSRARGRRLSDGRGRGTVRAGRLARACPGGTPAPTCRGRCPRWRFRAGAGRTTKQRQGLEGLSQRGLSRQCQPSLEHCRVDRAGSRSRARGRRLSDGRGRGTVRAGRLARACPGGTPAPTCRGRCPRWRFPRRRRPKLGENQHRHPVAVAGAVEGRPGKPGVSCPAREGARRAG